MGVLVQHELGLTDLELTKQCIKAVNSANRVLAMMSRTFVCKFKGIMFQLYNSLGHILNSVLKTVFWWMFILNDVLNCINDVIVWRSATHSYSLQHLHIAGLYASSLELWPVLTVHAWLDLAKPVHMLQLHYSTSKLTPMLQVHLLNILAHLVLDNMLI